jgi:hypothetical protein
LVSNAAHRNDERQERHPYFQLRLGHSRFAGAIAAPDFVRTGAREVLTMMALLGLGFME